jgi:DNA end-binding protein Ku
MARSIWSGSLAFGLVNVPVALYSATESKDVHFHQFQRDTGKRVRNMRVVEGTDDEVAYDDIVKGYEVSKGKYVMVTPEELATADPGRSRTIDIEDFVSLADIDPIYFEKSYFVAPGRSAGADKPYGLLLKAMRDSGRVAIGRFVMRDKQYLAAIRPVDDVLVLETLYFGDEVRAARDLPGVPVKVSLSKRELEIADRLIESLTTDWDPEKYHDTHREEVLELIHRKGEGEEIDTSEPEEPEGEVLDLMAALQASLDRPRPASSRAARKAASSRSSSAKAPAKRTAATTSAAKTSRATKPVAKKKPAAKRWAATKPAATKSAATKPAATKPARKAS